MEASVKRPRDSGENGIASSLKAIGRRVQRLHEMVDANGTGVASEVHTLLRDIESCFTLEVAEESVNYSNTALRLFLVVMKTYCSTRVGVGARQSSLGETNWFAITHHSIMSLLKATPYLVAFGAAPERTNNFLQCVKLVAESACQHSPTGFVLSLSSALARIGKPLAHIIHHHPKQNSAVSIAMPEVVTTTIEISSPYCALNVLFGVCYFLDTLLSARVPCDFSLEDQQSILDGLATILSTCCDGTSVPYVEVACALLEKLITRHHLTTSVAGPIVLWSLIQFIRQSHPSTVPPCVQDVIVAAGEWFMASSPTARCAVATQLARTSFVLDGLTGCVICRNLTELCTLKLLGVLSEVVVASCASESEKDQLGVDFLSQNPVTEVPNASATPSFLSSLLSSRQEPADICKLGLIGLFTSQHLQSVIFPQLREGVKRLPLVASQLGPACCYLANIVTLTKGAVCIAGPLLSIRSQLATPQLSESLSALTPTLVSILKSCSQDDFDKFELEKFSFWIDEECRIKAALKPSAVTLVAPASAAVQHGRYPFFACTGRISNQQFGKSLMNLAFEAFSFGTRDGLYIVGDAAALAVTTILEQLLDWLQRCPTNVIGAEGVLTAIITSAHAHLCWFRANASATPSCNFHLLVAVLSNLVIVTTSHLSGVDASAPNAVEVATHHDIGNQHISASRRQLQGAKCVEELMSSLVELLDGRIAPGLPSPVVQQVLCAAHHLTACIPSVTRFDPHIYSSMSSPSSDRNSNCQVPDHTDFSAKCIAKFCVHREKFEIPSSVWHDSTSGLMRQLLCLIKMTTIVGTSTRCSTQGAAPEGSATALLCIDFLDPVQYKNLAFAFLKLVLTALYFAHQRTSMALKSLAVELVSSLLDVVHWSADDVVRMHPAIVDEQESFQRLCDISMTQPGAVLLRNLDILLPMRVFCDDDDNKVSMGNLERQLGENVRIQADGRQFMISYLLLQATKTEEDTMQRVTKFAQFTNSKVEDVPEAVRRCFALAFASILSSSDTATPDACCFAMSVCAALASCDATSVDIKRSMRDPVHAAAGETVSKILTSRVIEVLDIIVRNIVSFEPIASHTSRPSEGSERPVPLSTSTNTQHRWLLGLTNLVLFLNTRVSVIAPKLPAVFEECSLIHRHRLQVCVLWKTLVKQLDSTYLRDQAPSIITDLLAIEQLGVDGRCMEQLREAVGIVHSASAQEPFWVTFQAVLKRGSNLMMLLMASVGKQPSSADHTATNIENFVESFIGIIQRNSSTKCHAVFAKAFHSFLTSADVATRGNVMKSAHAETLVQTLLGISAVGAKTQLLIVECVGLIGAVTPHLDTAAEPSTSASFPLKITRYTSSSNAQQLSKIDQTLQWRELIADLLATYCPRALNNTSDARMHDRVAYAVQQLIRVGVAEERQELKTTAPLGDNAVIRTEELKYPWWNNLTQRTRLSLLPFINTKYQTKVIFPYDRACPEMKPSMPFLDWRWNWFRNIVSRTSGVFGKIFESVRNVAKRDTFLCTFLIPVMVVCVIRHGTAMDVTEIVAEFNTIFSTASRGTEEHVQLLFQVLDQVQILCDMAKTALVERNRIFCGLSEDRTRSLVDSCTTFLARISTSIKVNAALSINSPLRALRFQESERYLPPLESIIVQTPKMQDIFAGLQDRPSAIAVHNHTPQQDWGERAIWHERNGQWTMALQACEIHLQQEPCSIEHQLCTLRCLQHLGQLHLMAHYAKSLLSNHSSQGIAVGTNNHVTHTDILRYANEARWRLGMWDAIEEVTNESLESPGTKKVGTQLEVPSLVTSVLELYRLNQNTTTLENVRAATEHQKKLIIPTVFASARENYCQAYPQAVMLHALADIDIVANFVFENASLRRSHSATIGEPKRIAEMKANTALDMQLSERLAVVEMTADSRELLLALHRRIFSLFDESAIVSKTWVSYAKLLNENGFADAALNAARQGAQSSRPYQKCFTTHAKLLYAKGEYVAAVEYARLYARDEMNCPRIRAKLQMYATNWAQELRMQVPAEIIESYGRSLSYEKTEKGYFHLARYNDRLFHATKSMLPPDAAPTPDSIDAVENYAVHAIDGYGSALAIGGTKTYVVGLPRLLTLWLDSTASLTGIQSVVLRAKATSVIARINAKIERLFLPNVPSPSSAAARPVGVSPIILMTSIFQILSRIGHCNGEVLNIIYRLILLLLQHFPQQSLWAVCPIYHSKQLTRSNAIKTNIITPYQKSGKEQTKLVETALAITTCMIEICNSQPDIYQTTKLDETTFCRRAEKYFQATNFILPLISTITAVVPSTTHTSAADSSTTFPSAPTFLRFDSKVTIMSSIQKPKKIGIITKQGTIVSFLCKARDEPRKDLRMMDIAGLINNLFLQDTQSKKMNFALRRYAVAALSDDTAMIQWVENTCVLRKVVDDSAALDGSGVNTKIVKEWRKKLEESKMTPLQLLEHALQQAKPVLHQWFLRKFPSHREWYVARNLFTQSCALWSTVGHVLGVGDRHAENILIDTNSGEVLHIDFACMFDKGELLDCAERVRFRLTQNIVDPMGVVRCDGPFRSACVTSLTTQTKHRDALMTILDTLLHEPLVEWASKTSTSKDKVDPRQLFVRVARRLDGFLDLYSVPREKDTLAMTVEGQVAKLIHHSSAIENLAAMYTWWMAWI